jgi:hypothetical protein
MAWRPKPLESEGLPGRRLTAPCQPPSQPSKRRRCALPASAFVGLLRGPQVDGELALPG